MGSTLTLMYLRTGRPGLHIVGRSTVPRCQFRDPPGDGTCGGPRQVDSLNRNSQSRKTDPNFCEFHNTADSHSSDTISLFLLHFRNWPSQHAGPNVYGPSADVAKL